MNIILDKPVEDYDYNNSNRIVDRLIELQRDNDFSLTELARVFNNYILDECEKDDNDELNDPSQTHKIDLKSFVKLKNKEVIYSTCETLDLVNSKLGIVSVSKNKLWDLDAKVTYYTIKRPNDFFIALLQNIKENCDLIKILNLDFNIDKNIKIYLGHIGLDFIDSIGVKKVSTEGEKNDGLLIPQPEGTFIAVRTFQRIFYRNLIVSKSLYIEKYLAENPLHYKKLFNLKKLLRSQVGNYTVENFDALLEKEKIEKPVSYDDYIKYFASCNKYFESDVINFIEEVNDHYKEFNRSQKTSLAKPEIHKLPVFKESEIPNIVDTLTPYFPNDKEKLSALINSGEVPKGKLVFHGPATSLLDFFRQLISAKILVIAQGNWFSEWVNECFLTIKNGKISEIATRSVTNNIAGVKRDRPPKVNWIIDIDANDGVVKINW